MPRVINIKTLREKQFHTLDIDGYYLNLFGKPERNFKALFYGPSGSGKSTFALKFVDYLSTHLNAKVLYNSHEEGYSETLRLRVLENDISARKLFFADRMNFSDMCEKAKRGHYRFVVIDSIQYMRLTYKDYQAFEKRFPRKALILISQAKNNGGIKGTTDILHAVDIKVRIHKGNAEVVSRFAPEPKTVRLFTPNCNQLTLL